MNATLARIEEILDGLEPEIADVPIDDLPDYLPRMSQDGC